MEIITVPFNELSHDCYREAVLEGYQYGCACGESFKTAEGAENCRKCRVYLKETPTAIYFTPLEKGAQK